MKLTLNAQPYNADDAIVEACSSILRTYAQYGNSHPIGVTPSEWTEQIELVLYTLDSYLDRWDYSSLQGEHDQRTSAAQAALRWIADNLPTLWD